MNIKSIVRSAAAALVMASMPLTIASAESNPVFGAAKYQTLSTSDMNKVVGQGATADYYGFYGAYYGAYAALYGAYGLYYSGSTETSNYYNAYYYAYYSYIYYYYAYYYSPA